MVEIKFALNRMVAPHADLSAFLQLASETGATAVEVRNDIEGHELANGMDAGALAARIEGAGLEVASINALQRFNDWTAEREREARLLARYARQLGAPGIVLCPVIDANHSRSGSELEGDLRLALKSLKPILADNGVTGFVEPLGMVDSMLRHQRPAVEAICDIDGHDVFSLCHDTFQHYRASDPEYHPQYTGLVHISGIVNRELPREKLLEPHRGFVDEEDIAGNAEQLALLLGRGYRGHVSFEPFDPAVHAMEQPGEYLKSSMDHVRRSVAARLAST